MIEEVELILKNHGFVTCSYEGIRSCFDIIAKDKKHIFLIKIFEYVESLNKKNASDLKEISMHLSATPLIIAKRTKNSEISEDVVYFRYDIPTVNLKTFIRIVEEDFPSIYSTRGNYCVNIDKKFFLGIKKELNMRLEDIANELEVSKQAIYRYETHGRIPVNVLEKIEEIFGIKVIKKCDEKIFESPKNPKNKKFETGHEKDKQPDDIIKKLSEIGFQTWSGSAPFDVFAKEKEKIFIVASDDPRVLQRKTFSTKKTLEIIPGYCACVSRHKYIIKNDVKLITTRDIKEIESAEELMSIIMEHY